MWETRTVAVCSDCMLEWVPEGDPACRDAEHRGRHRTFELHLHRSTLQLPDGTAVTPVSFFVGDPYGREQAPDFGVYLDPRWKPPWPHRVLDWPDFGVPTDLAPVTRALSDLLDRARAGERVEVGCWGGHGRTGTALACLSVLSGCPAEEAVGWVRSNYCARAVETPAQEAFVLTLAGHEPPPEARAPSS